jgi:hypothetical protein
MVKWTAVAIGLAFLVLLASAVLWLSEGHGGDKVGGDEDAAQRAEVELEGLPPRRSTDAALVALAADRLAPSPATEMGMLEIALQNLGIERRIDTGSPQVTAALRLRHLLVTAGGDRALRVWRPATGSLIGVAHSRRPFVSLGEAFGLPLAVGADKAGALTLVDMSDPHHPRLRDLPKSHGRGPALTTSFSSAGNQVRVLRSDGELEAFTTLGGRRVDAVDLVAADEGLLGGSSLGHLKLAQFETSGWGAPTQLLLGFSNGAVVRSDLRGTAAILLVPPGFSSAPLTSLAAEPGGGEIAIGTKAGMITLGRPGASPELRPGPSPSSVAFNSDDELLAADAEGLARSTNVYLPEEANPVGPLFTLVPGAGGVVGLYRGGVVALIGPTATGVGLEGFVDGPALSFLPGGDLAVAEQAYEDQSDAISIVRPGHEVDNGFPVVNPEVRSLRAGPHWWPKEAASETGLGLYLNDVVADREFIVAGGQDPTGEAAVLVWSTRTGMPVRRLPLATGGLNPEEPSIVADVVLVPGQDLLAAYSAAQQLVAIWSTTTWKLVASVPVGRATDLTVTPDESSLVLVGPQHEVADAEFQTGPSKLTFIDPADGRIDHEVQIPEAGAIAYSPDGQSLALAAKGGTLRLLSDDGRKELRPPIHLDAEPLAIAWQPEGGLIAVGTEGFGVELVNPLTAKESAALPSDGEWVSALSWSPDGHFLADVPGLQGEDGNYEPGPTEIWKVGDGFLRKRMCQLAGGPIGRKQWRSLIGDGGSYRALCRPHRVVFTARTERKVVLGSAGFESNGTGWGTAEPPSIFNGGDASGDIAEIQWHDWGGSTATGIGRTSIFKPTGGYYSQSVPIQLRAHALGRCGLEPAYTELSVRSPSRPGGPFGKWFSWSGASTLCAPPTF